MATAQTRIDQIVDGIYRISTWQEPYKITFNQFLIDVNDYCLLNQIALKWTHECG